MKTRRFKYIWCAWIIGLIVSCSHEINPSDDFSSSDGIVDVNVEVELSPSQTDYLRSRDPSALAQIINVDALVFDKDGKYLERISVDETTLTTTPSSASFKMKMKTTPERRTIHLVVNGRYRSDNSDRLNFNDITPGMLEQDAIELLETYEPVYNGNETFTDKAFPVVMWGSFQMLNGISATSKVTGVKLLRCVAIFDIMWPYSGYGVLKGGFLQGATASGYVAPSNWQAGAAVPTAPRLISNPTILPYNKTTLIEANDGGDPHNHFVAYSYERNCTLNDYQFVILHVDHASSSSFGNIEGYYKIALTDGNGNPFNIIRNHRYVIRVKSVNGPGYPTLELALGSNPSNDLKIEITDESEKYPIIVADGQYRMGISNNKLFVFGEIQGSNNLNDIELCKILVDPNNNDVRTHLNYTSTGMVNNIRTQQISSSLNGVELSLFADFNSSNMGAGNGEARLYLYNGNLAFRSLDVVWLHNKRYNTNSADSKSYYLNLFSTSLPSRVESDNWNLRILDVDEDPSNPSYPWITLSDREDNAFTVNGPVKYVGELSSKISSNVYIHVLKGGNWERATLLISGYAQNEPVVRKIIVIRQK